jgi:hypothetical protein
VGLEERQAQTIRAIGGHRKVGVFHPAGVQFGDVSALSDAIRVDRQN